MKRSSLIVIAASLLLAACGPSIDKQELRLRIARLQREVTVLQYQANSVPPPVHTEILSLTGPSGPTPEEKIEDDAAIAKWKQEKADASVKLQAKEKELADAQAALGGD